MASNEYIFRPSLTEPGVKYFLDQTLKNCRCKKDIYTNKYLNIVIFLFFIAVLTCVLIYKYKTRPTEEDRKKKKLLKRDYFLTKVRKLQTKKAKQLSQSITNLPKFESPFETLHKNFYDT